MPFADFVGWVAALLMLATFSAKNLLTLRALAISANVAFIGYGLSAQLPPVLALHCVLLPVNLWRFAQTVAMRLERRPVEADHAPADLAGSSAMGAARR